MTFFFFSLPAFNHLVFDFIGLYFLLESKWDIQMVRLSLLCEKGQLQEAHLLQEPKCQWQNCKKCDISMYKRLYLQRVQIGPALLE